MQRLRPFGDQPRTHGLGNLAVDGDGHRAQAAATVLKVRRTSRGRRDAHSAATLSDGERWWSDPPPRLTKIGVASNARVPEARWYRGAAPLFCDALSQLSRNEYEEDHRFHRADGSQDGQYLGLTPLSKIAERNSIKHEDVICTLLLVRDGFEPILMCSMISSLGER